MVFMQRKFRQFIGSLLLLTFLFGTVSVSAAELRSTVNIISSQNAVNAAKMCSPADTALQRDTWVRIGYYYGDRHIEDIFNLTLEAIANFLIGKLNHFPTEVVVGIASILLNSATNPNITAYYKREMYRSQDNPMYWRDIMTYYYDSGHTLQVGSPVQSNVYEMIDKQAHDVIKQLEK